MTEFTESPVKPSSVLRNQLRDKLINIQLELRKESSTPVQNTDTAVAEKNTSAEEALA